MTVRTTQTEGAGDEFYTADQVLSGWRRYSKRRWSERPIVMPFRIDEDGDSHIGDPVRDSWRLDVEFQMAVKVERFFRCHIHLHALKPFLIAGSDDPRFGDWYSMHPLKIVFKGDCEIGKRAWPELDAVPLKQAVERWNSDNPRSEISPWVARRAARNGELDAWQPDGGQWYSASALVGEWVSERKREKGGAREGAGRPRSTT